MKISHLELIWAEKPECNLPIMEIWIEHTDLWFTIFIDNESKSLKMEVFPPAVERKIHEIDFTEFERLLQTAKHDLQVMASSSNKEGR